MAEPSSIRDRYEILEEIGAGGIAEVRKGRQRATGQVVAIKLLQLRRGGGAPPVELQVARFQREMELCAQLHHPNIVRLLDYSGQVEEQGLYSVFEYVPGRNLEEVLQDEGALDAREAIHWMGQVLDALACAHSLGVIHRDLKPSNIMINPRGARRNALLLDFGLAGYAVEAQAETRRRLTASGELLGTLAYAAPEQLHGKAATPLADLYSWGLVFLEVLTGAPAIRGESIEAIVHEQFSAHPIAIPGWLRGHPLGRLLAEVTAKPVERRRGTPENLLRALERVRPEELERLRGQPEGGAQRRAAAAVSSADGERWTAPAESSGERRQITVLSCRLTQARPGADEVDVEEFDDLTRQHWTVYDGIAHREGGHIAETVGKRALILFGYPQAREDAADAAVRAALGIAAHAEEHERAGQPGLRLQVQIGIHTGLVLFRDASGVVGTTPEIAMQLDSLALPGEILVSEATQRLLRSDAAAQQRGERLFGDLSRPLSVYCLSRGTGATTAHGAAATAAAQRTPFVDRRLELRRLSDAWEQAQRGACQSVLISGDAGMGKSRMLLELRQNVLDESAWVECSCVPEAQNSPLHPIATALAQLFGDLPPSSALEGLGVDAREIAPLLEAVLYGSPDAAPAGPALSPQRRQERTLEAIVSLLFRMAEERALVFVVEDLHWADATTLSLLAGLVEEVHAAQLGGVEKSPRLLAVFTTRSDFLPPWPVTGMTLIPVRGLAVADVHQLTAAGCGPGVRLPPPLLDQIAARADGVPLFVEEMTRMVLDSGPDPEALSDVEIPGTLRDLLTARLDGLAPGPRETAQLASALGREFDLAVLQAVSEKSEAELRDDLERLGQAQLIHRRRRAPGERFLFKHALLRDTTYDSMLRSTQRAVHERIALALEARFPELCAQQPELAALHFEKGRRDATALQYWKRAGERATARWAHFEATRHFERALALLPAVPGAQRAGLELELQMSLGSGLLATRGYAAPEVEQVYARCRQLCQQQGDPPLPVVYGVWAVTLLRGDRQGSAELARSLEAFIARESDRRGLLMAHSALGALAFLKGELGAAELHLQEAMSRFQMADQQGLVREYGGCGGLYGHLYMSSCQWFLGRPERARRNQAEVLALAEQLEDPYTIATALQFSISLGCLASRPAETRAAAERAIAIATEHRYPYALGISICALGWAQVREGDGAAGVARIAEGLALLRATGAQVPLTYYQSLLVDALLSLGETERALDEVNRALQQSQGSLERFYEAELHRLKGELLLRAPQTAALAEPCFARALEIAREQGARQLELRAALGRARLLHAGGRAHGLRDELAKLCAAWTEGPDLPELAEARALLAQLP